MSLYLRKSGRLLERGKRLGVLEEQQTGQFVQSVVRERQNGKTRIGAVI